MSGTRAKARDYMITETLLFLVVAGFSPRLLGPISFDSPSLLGLLYQSNCSTIPRPELKFAELRRVK
jgi:hypothetical protein